jgi:hypothetical protein
VVANCCTDCFINRTFHAQNVIPNAPHRNICYQRIKHHALAQTPRNLLTCKVRMRQNYLQSAQESPAANQQAEPVRWAALVTVK